MSIAIIVYITIYVVVALSVCSLIAFAEGERLPILFCIIPSILWPAILAFLAVGLVIMVVGAGVYAFVRAVKKQ